MYENSRYIGFQNEVFNQKTKILESFQKEHHLITKSPYAYHSFKNKKNIYEITPTICQWISERVFGSEIQTNVLISILLSCILRIEYPERFLFINRHSATGKRTFFMVLASLISTETVYTISAEDFSCDFGFED